MFVSLYFRYTLLKEQLIVTLPRPSLLKSLKNQYQVELAQVYVVSFHFVKNKIFFFVGNAGQYLQLTPGEEIVFRREEGETTGMLVMTNTSNCNVAYKVFSNL